MFYEFIKILFVLLSATAEQMLYLINFADCSVNKATKHNKHPHAAFTCNTSSWLNRRTHTHHTHTTTHKHHFSYFTLLINLKHSLFFHTTSITIIITHTLILFTLLSIVCVCEKLLTLFSRKTGDLCE